MLVSGGNFHAEPVALACDAMAVAIAEVGAIAERRIAMLIDSSVSRLPPFLAADPGLNSGFMIAHVTAAALASENKSLAHPASVDSLPTSANQEDHVRSRRCMHCCATAALRWNKTVTWRPTSSAPPRWWPMGRWRASCARCLACQRCGFRPERQSGRDCARASNSARSCALRASPAARSNWARASPLRPSLARKSPRTLGSHW